MLNENDVVLVLEPLEKIDYHYAELDANAINFYLLEPYRYFSIAVGIFLEGDEVLDQADFEIGDQQMHRGGPQKIAFAPGTVELSFAAGKPFLKRYKAVRLRVSRGVDRKMVDFFVNSLFFGPIVEYTEDFDDLLKVTQTEFPVLLGDLDEG